MSLLLAVIRLAAPPCQCRGLFLASVCLAGCRRWLDSQRRLAELEARPLASRGASPQPAVQQPAVSPGVGQDAGQGAADVVYDVEVITADCKVGAHMLDRVGALLCRRAQQGGRKTLQLSLFLRTVQRGVLYGHWPSAFVLEVICTEGARHHCLAPAVP